MNIRNTVFSPQSFILKRVVTKNALIKFVLAHTNNLVRTKSTVT